MSPDPSRRRILVAEDDPAIHDLLVTRLTLAGYATLQARDGFQALQAICAGRPDAAILDINLPGLDGFQILKKMKARGANLHTPVLVLSARKAPSDIQTAIQLGARDYLSKPFDDAQLLQRVARLLRPVPARAATPGRLPAEDDDALLL